MSRDGWGAASRMERAFHELTGAQLPVRLRAWDGSESGPQQLPVLTVGSPRALRRLLYSPVELGLAQAYVTGELDVDGDLSSAFRTVWQRIREQDLHPPRFGIRHLPGLLATALRLGPAGLRILGPPPAAPASQARLRGRLHSRRRDRAAIAHHYDLSNEFYELILEERMLYSCGYWTGVDAGYGVAHAQRDKLDLICRKLELRPGAALLDVGCGWGGLAIHAAQHYGATVTGVTLSQQQLEFGRRRVAELGLEGRVVLRLQDYRELPDGAFDAIASVEMGEHVGSGNYPEFAATLHRLLRPAGRLLVQQMSRGSNHPGGGPFIESFIAPDMHMRPMGETVSLLERAGFEMRDVEAMREHYVHTVAAWYETFQRRYQEAVSLVGEEVARVWRLYLVGGGLSFEQGRMGVDQFLAVRSAAGGLSGMPPTRDAWHVGHHAARLDGAGDADGAGDTDGAGDPNGHRR